MTRYLCTDPRHTREGVVRPVDVTSQVRLERELIPRPLAYLAPAEAVVRDVSEISGLDPEAAQLSVLRSLTGTPTPLDLPVIITSERALLFHGQGLHEVEELRRTEPAIEHLMLPGDGGASDVIVLDEDATLDIAGTTYTEAPSARTTATQTMERGGTLPQGVFDLWDLADRLAGAAGDRSRVVQALREAPRAPLGATGAPASGPWRVVITCPRPEGSPPRYHDTVFLGTGLAEAHVVQGTPVNGLDAALERDAGRDLAPAAELARSERRLGLLLGAGALLATVVLLGAWVSGGLATASRETPGWLASGLGLVMASLAFGGIALMAPKDPAGNVNDTLTVRHFYSSRMQLLHLAMASGVMAFAVGLILSVVPPIMAVERAHPAADVRLTSGSSGVEAAVLVHASGLPSGTRVQVVMRSFVSASSDGRPAGLVAATSDYSGVVDLMEEIAVPAGTSYFGVQVLIEGELGGECSPAAATGPGCTVVAVGAQAITPAPTLPG